MACVAELRQLQAAIAGFAFGFEYRAGFIEAAEQGGGLVEVGGEVVRIRRVRHALQHVFEFQQLGGKLFFQRFGQNGWRGRVPFAGFAEHALHAGVGVLQVGGGVAFK